MRYLLRATNTLIVKGPASVRIKNGEAGILGVSLGPADNFIIRTGKQMPIEARSDVELEIIISHASGLIEIAGNSLPLTWQLASENVAEATNKTVIVIGATDVGKSTLCSFLINNMLSQSLTVHMIDADIGQGEIGPPTTIAMATPNHQILSLADLQPRSMIFLGHTSPSQVEDGLIRGVKRLATTEKSGLTIINTDGWILGQEAIRFKTKLIRTLKPDLVLAVGSTGEIQTLIEKKIRYMRVEIPQYVLTRSRVERSEFRAMNYRRFLEGALSRKLSLDEISLKFPNSKMGLNGDLNFIVGFLNSEGLLLEIGILLGLNEKSIKIYTRYSGESNQIEVGRVKLLKNGSELSFADA